MNLEEQTRSLIALVEADRERQCDAIRGEALARASALRRQAQAEARARMREAFEEERARMAAAVGAAQAHLQTRRRLNDQQRAAQVLSLAADRLPAELARRWGDPAARAAWVARVAAAARAALQAGDWRFVHAPGWSAAERDAFMRSAISGAGVRAVFEEDASLQVGLKVAAGGNVVDGTLGGLLADRDAIGAQLLHLLEGES